MACSPAEEVKVLAGLAGDARISWALRWFSLVALVCIASGTMLYCYDETLQRWRDLLVTVHEISGDLTILLLIVYLWVHMKRTWGLLPTRKLSWWSGMVAVAAWLIASATGAWGQAYTLERFTAAWWLHAMASIAGVVIAGYHAAHGFRAKLNDLDCWRSKVKSQKSGAGSRSLNP